MIASIPPAGFDLRSRCNLPFHHFAILGHDVAGLGHGGWNDRGAYVWGLRRWHAVDVDPGSLRAHGGEPEIVVHCAGGALVGASFRDRYADFRRTVTATAAVPNFLRERVPHARFDYPSSAAVYGIAERIPIADTDRLSPISPYGSHKLAAEELCRPIAKPFGLAVLVVRFCSLDDPYLGKQLLWVACGKHDASANAFNGTGDDCWSAPRARRRPRARCPMAGPRLAPQSARFSPSSPRRRASPPQPAAATRSPASP